MKIQLDGATFISTQEFLDDYEDALIPASGYPRVLVKEDSDILAEYSTSPTQNVGQWQASVTLPKLGIDQKKVLNLVWRFKTSDGEKIVVKEEIIVEPEFEKRFSNCVMMNSDTTFSLVLPFPLYSGDTLNGKVFEGNEIVSTFDHTNSSPHNSVDSCEVNPTVVGLTPSLASKLVQVTGRRSNKPIVYNYMLWCVTPQMVIAAQQVEEFLNKSHIENTIPELQYTQGDLFLYLERGLNLFNSIGYLTAFSGLNMQGFILDSWVICACYYALGAQLLAEGSLNFDFSGQGVSLNVDRTPQLDSALGRIESLLESRVLPVKKQLWNNGYTKGDGSVGKSAINNPANRAILRLTNSPTTRINGLGVSNVFLGRRF